MLQQQLESNCEGWLVIVVLTVVVRGRCFHFNQSSCWNLSWTPCQWQWPGEGEQGGGRGGGASVQYL